MLVEEFLFRLIFLDLLSLLDILLAILLVSDFYQISREILNDTGKYCYMMRLKKGSKAALLGLQ